MARISIGGQPADWNQLGLPAQPFRVYIRAGMAEYRPVNINPENRVIRARMVSLLTTSPLAGNLARLNQVTSTSGRLEHAAYIAGDGSLMGVVSGSQDHAPRGPAPLGNLVGFVHTHPVPNGVMAPPSADDYDASSFQRLPIQLVAEMGGRVWGLFFSGGAGYCSLLGMLALAGMFQPVTDASTNLVYQTVSEDQIHMEQFQGDEDREAAARQRQMDAMRALADQRRREAEARRAGH
ncbi:MAG: hypothetical protein ACRD9W_24230 [Terriglobia bacterium]